MTKPTAEELIKELETILGSKGLLTKSEDMQPYVVDYRGRRTGDAIAVALPATAEEAAAAVKAATSLGIPVFPQGGNTGLCYGSVPASGLVVAMRRMRKIREVDLASGLIAVDAGITLSEVHEEAEKYGLQFPLYLGSEGTAQIGGLISTNAGGTGVLKYGTMRELISGVEVALADGSLYSDLSGLRKDNRGYPISQLFCGAEGTLGLVTGAILRLQPKMKSNAHAWLAYDSLEPLLETAIEVKKAFGSTLEALELLDYNETNYVCKHVESARLPFDSIPQYSLMIELTSPNASENLTENLEKVLSVLMEKELFYDAIIAQNEQQGADIWHFRHSVTEANKMNGIGVVLDTSVRSSKVPAFIEAADIATKQYFPEAERAIVSHLGDGNVHYIVMFPFDVWKTFPNQEEKELEVEHIIHNVAAQFDGSFSAEHGIGRKLTSEMGRLVDPVRLNLLQQVKSAFDPKGLMNPGALLPPPT